MFLNVPFNFFVCFWYSELCLSHNRCSIFPSSLHSPLICFDNSGQGERFYTHYFSIDLFFLLTKCFLLSPEYSPEEKGYLCPNPPQSGVRFKKLGSFSSTQQDCGRERISWGSTYPYPYLPSSEKVAVCFLLTY